MVIHQKLLPRTKKRGVFYLSLKISSLNRLASYDAYPQAHGQLIIVTFLLSSALATPPFALTLSCKSLASLIAHLHRVHTHLLTNPPHLFTNNPHLSLSLLIPLTLFTRCLVS